MKMTSLLLTALSLMLGSATYMNAARHARHSSASHSDQVSFHIPEIDMSQIKGYDKIADVAQYGGADWNNVVGIVHNVSLQQAKEIADSNPAITYFFYMKGGYMHLESKRGFVARDAVFFSGTPWWGSAPGYADGYVKQTTNN